MFYDWVGRVGNKQLRQHGPAVPIATSPLDADSADESVGVQTVSPGVRMRAREWTGYRADVVVAQDGTGSARSIQEAVNRAPIDGINRFVVFIKAGVYEEKVHVDAPRVTLIGEDPSTTVIQWGDTAAMTDPLTQTRMGTNRTATVGIDGDRFSAQDITFKNTAPRPMVTDGGQAVALRCGGDMSAFYNCRFLGYQDTLYVVTGRQYFKSCYIQGSVDFIFGNATVMFVDCDLYADVDVNGGYLTAQKRGVPLEHTGFVFIRNRVSGNGQVYLGRAWGNASRVVFAYTLMDDVIVPLGWDSWDKAIGMIFYGEYRCTGPGSARIIAFKELIGHAACESIANGIPAHTAARLQHEDNGTPADGRGTSASHFAHLVYGASFHVLAEDSFSVCAFVVGFSAVRARERFDAPEIVSLPPSAKTAEKRLLVSVDSV
ncbi:hypothetical protein CBR_g50772 [Chara braunii]|uniref:Pectinesterase n=1 Tax=Chara braunii TaxID=69332 RepID=A0A388K5V1_CHABU|nr:hypothetical protein CBR_g50772 [Chara braunii]|eukprot:GBG65411.1 hypothetical protein CBR_g50772 [Chara braunii]